MGYAWRRGSDAPGAKGNIEGWREVKTVGSKKALEAVALLAAIILAGVFVPRILSVFLLWVIFATNKPYTIENP